MKNFKPKAEAAFDGKFVSELARIIGLSDAANIALFRADLVEICAHYFAVIAVLPCDLPGAPYNLSLTKRADWLETNVMKPAERLLEALADDQQPMFSTWPYPLTVPEVRNNTSLCADLVSLLETSKGLRDSLRAQQSEDAGHNQELRAEIFASIARLLTKHCPTLKPNRGVYDPELRRRVGAYVDVVGMIYSRITGLEDNLDRLIRVEINHPS